MAPRFSKCQNMAKNIGNRRIDKILQEFIFREKKDYQCDEKEHNQMIEELEARDDYRRGIISEL